MTTPFTAPDDPSVWAGHQVHLVYDWWDTLCARAVGRLHDPDHGTVVLHVPAPGRWFERELIEALHTAAARTGTSKLPLSFSRAQPRQDALNMLEASGALDLVVHRAQWLPTQLLADLLDIAAAADMRTWLLVQPEIHEASMRLVDSNIEQVLDWDQFWEAWTDRPLPAVGPPSTAPAAQHHQVAVTAVPDCDVVHFLPQAHASLNEQEYRAVEAEFDAGRRSVRLGLRHDLRHAASTPGSDLASPVCQWLADAVLGPDLASTIARLRGGQAELLRAGWRLDVNLGVFVDSYAQLPRHPPDTDGAIKALLQTWRSPDGVVGPLLAAIGVPEDHTWEVRIRDVATDGAQVTVLGRPCAVPAVARAALLCGWLSRLDNGASADEPLMILPIVPPPPRTVGELVDGPWRRLGIQVGRHAVFGDNDIDARRLRRLGVTVQELPREGLPLWSAKAPPTRESEAASPEQGVLDCGRLLRRRLSLGEADMISRLLQGQALPASSSVYRSCARLRQIGVLDKQYALSPSARWALTGQR